AVVTEWVVAVPAIGGKWCRSRGGRYRCARAIEGERRMRPVVVADVEPALVHASVRTEDDGVVADRGAIDLDPVGIVLHRLERFAAAAEPADLLVERTLNVGKRGIE